MPLIIGGFARSGTTLLRKLCGRHPDVMVTGEFANFLGLGQPYGPYVRQSWPWWRRRAGRQARLLRPRRQPRWRTWLENHAFVARYLLALYRQRQDVVDVTVIENTLKKLFPEATVVGDKFPNYVFSLDELVEMEGLSRVVIYRDGRDVTSSYLKRARTDWRHGYSGQHMNTAEKIITRWVDAIQIMERHAHKLHVIRYEELIQYPERELDALGDYLGVDPVGFPADTVRQTSIGKHKEGLTGEELATVMRIAGPTLRKLNYV